MTGCSQLTKISPRHTTEHVQLESLIMLFYCMLTILCIDSISSFCAGSYSLCIKLLVSTVTCPNFNSIIYTNETYFMEVFKIHVLPLGLQIASISSITMMCRSLSSPCSIQACSASSKCTRRFFSDSPKYLLMISGALINFTWNIGRKCE